jgi:hypothetical protein
MRQQKKSKYPNALKHGAYSAIHILPGEDRAEFEALLADLIKEWQPDGPSELDAVDCLAKAKWLKLRHQKFLDVQLVQNMSDPKHPSYNECFNLTGLVVLLQTEPEDVFYKYASRCLTEDRLSYLRHKVPREEFESHSKWAEAMIDEITSVLIPSLTPQGHEAQQQLGLIYSARTFSAELFDRDIALSERLDAMNDRAIKRLIQMKAAKQMLGLAPTNETKGESVKLPKRRRLRG